MKIGPLDPKTPAVPAANERRGPPAPGREGGSDVAPSARVELSSQAALLAGESGRADFDALKVERIGQAIRDGRYRIDAEAIADKLIANAQELLQRPGR